MPSFRAEVLAETFKRGGKIGIKATELLLSLLGCGGEVVEPDFERLAKVDEDFLSVRACLKTSGELRMAGEDV